MNKLLLKSVREYKKQSILTPIFVLLEVLLEVMIPMEMAKIIDIGIAGGNLPYIIQRGLHTGCDGNACPVFRRNSRKDGGNRGGGICKKSAP